MIKFNLLNHGKLHVTLFSHWVQVTKKEYKNTAIFTNQFSSVQVVVKRRKRKRRTRRRRRMRSRKRRRIRRMRRRRRSKKGRRRRRRKKELICKLTCTWWTFIQLWQYNKTAVTWVTLHMGKGSTKKCYFSRIPKYFLYQHLKINLYGPTKYFQSPCSTGLAAIF